MNKNFQNDFNNEIDSTIGAIQKVMNAVPHGKSQKAEAAREKIEFVASQATARLECMKNDYIVIDVLGLINSLKVTIISTAELLNDHADKKDGNRNRVNYGVIHNAANTLHKLGVSVDIDNWQDENGFLRVPQVEIDGNVTKYHNGYRKRATA